MKVIGLTGGIASGKSCVESYLKQRFPVIDADQVAREVVAPGRPGLQRIRDRFGDDILLPDGALNRAALRQRIASDRQAQQDLNGILHPIIIGEIKRQLAELAQTHEIAFVSAALMLESGSYKNYDGVILVSAPYELRLARVLQRDQMDEASARALMDKQMPDGEKRKLCDVEIINDDTLEALKAKTDAVLADLGVV